MTARLSINGREFGNGKGVDVMGHPLNALGWLAGTRGPKTRRPRRLLQYLDRGGDYRGGCRCSRTAAGTGERGRAPASAVDPLRAQAAKAFSGFLFEVAREVYPRHGFATINEAEFGARIRLG
jgi:hypothetical protein